MGPKLCKTLEIHLECMRVCVCMCGMALFKILSKFTHAKYVNV